jgi:arylsulfate sulfotransferase
MHPRHADSRHHLFYSPSARSRAETTSAPRPRRLRAPFAAAFAALCPAALWAAGAVTPPVGTVKIQTPPATVRPAAAPADTTAALSTLLFDFGDNLIGTESIRTAVVVTNTGKSTLILNPAVTGTPSFSIVAKESCGTSLAAGKSCDMVLRYAPRVASFPKQQTALLNLHFANAQGSPDTVALAGLSAGVKAGTVRGTNNPQVALYTLTLPFPGRAEIRFGTTKEYGTHTWYQSTDSNNGQISIFVAGMKAETLYHMSASVQFANGEPWADVDHTFQTGAIPAGMVLSVTTHTEPGMTPQPGVEFTNPLKGLAVFDLQGNEIWTYSTPEFGLDYLDGAKILPNGNFLVAIGVLPPTMLYVATPPTAIQEIREINLAGDTVREISVKDLNAELATATCQECSGLVLQTFHHDVTPLPNGHWLVLADVIRTLSTKTTPPLTNAPEQHVLGDVIVDLDQNLQPVWAWNEFNHLDPNRHPFEFPDWTHTNAVVYSPDDGALIVSMRHQSWVVKVDYHNGSGDGQIMWRLGQGGDFALRDGVDPTDWQYAQHGPSFFSPNTSGVFSLGMMDNGDDRIYPNGSPCTPAANLPASCLYSTIPIYQIDEKAMTATMTFHDKIQPIEYAFWGGNVDELANGNVEYDLCGVGSSSFVREVTRELVPKSVWSMVLTKTNFYRAFRIPSLYPGVQW